MSRVHKFHPTEIRLPGFEAAWAGEIPSKEGYCFGSTDGRLWFTQINSPLPGAKPIKVTSSDAPVTGVAFWDDFMAVSTPNEIVLQYHNHQENVAKQTGVEVGAHGILATRSGRFLAPIGIDGLLEIKPDVKANDYPSLHAPKGRTLNFYSAVLLPDDRNEAIACGTRRDGISLVRLPHEGSGGRIRVIPCEGVDAVDVCALGSPDSPLAVGAIGLDCSVFLLKNALEDVGPLALRFVGMQGNAYRILSTGGNIYVLTSDFLYVFVGLAERFLQGVNLGGTISVRAIPLQAVDMFLAYDQWLLVIMPDLVLAIDTHSFLDEPLEETFFNGQQERMQQRDVLATATWPQSRIEDFSIESDQMAMST